MAQKLFVKFNEKEIKHLLIDTYHLNKEDVFRYGIVEKLKEDYFSDYGQKITKKSTHN